MPLDHCVYMLTMYTTPHHTTHTHTHTHTHTYTYTFVAFLEFIHHRDPRFGHNIHLLYDRCIEGASAPLLHRL